MTYQDPRSTQGIMARGKAIYPSGSPNPKGKNQWNPKLAARARLLKLRKNNANSNKSS